MVTIETGDSAIRIESESGDSLVVDVDGCEQTGTWSRQA
jgi:hypothetical protein